MLIRPATVEDLPRCGQSAQEFYESAPSLGSFELDRFITMWTMLLGNGSGVIFLLLNGEVIVGAIGGVAYPDAYTAKLMATEFFWFVGESSRGRGVRLYRMFEDWARERGCAQIRMVHLLDLMPEKVARFYDRAGFKPLEVHYAKELTL